MLQIKGYCPELGVGGFHCSDWWSFSLHGIRQQNSEKRMNIKRVVAQGFVIVLVGLIAGCGQLMVKSSQGKDITLISPLYTQVNLHPDEHRKRLYALNFQQAGLLPLCSEVEILSIKKKAMKFRVKSTGAEYVYYTHRAISGGLAANIPEYFGAQCNTDNVKRLSKIDRKGIKIGKVLKGMTKKGVEYAIGYPPKHRTPSAEMETWRYWKNRYATMTVSFNEQGKVELIKGGS